MLLFERPDCIIPEFSCKGLILEVWHIPEIDNMVPQKQRKTESSEISNNALSQRNEGINSSSQNKMFSHPNDPSETDMKPNKSTSLNHSDRKNGQISNIQTSKTKHEGGTMIKIHLFKE